MHKDFFSLSFDSYNSLANKGIRIDVDELKEEGLDLNYRYGIVYYGKSSKTGEGVINYFWIPNENTSIHMSPFVVRPSSCDIAYLFRII